MDSLNAHVLGYDMEKLKASTQGSDTASAVNKIGKGDVIVSVNERSVAGMSVSRVLKMLQIKSRPLTVVFRPSSHAKLGSQGHGDMSVEVVFGPGSLGLAVRQRIDDRSAVVSGFSKMKDGSRGAAERCGKISVGQLLVSVNGTNTVGLSYAETMNVVRKAKRPTVMHFSKDPDYEVKIYMAYIVPSNRCGSVLYYLFSSSQHFFALWSGRF